MAPLVVTLLMHVPKCLICVAGDPLGSDYYRISIVGTVTDPGVRAPQQTASVVRVGATLRGKKRRRMVLLAR